MLLPQADPHAAVLVVGCDTVYPAMTTALSGACVGIVVPTHGLLVAQAMAALPHRRQCLLKCEQGGGVGSALQCESLPPPSTTIPTCVMTSGPLSPWTVAEGLQYYLAIDVVDVVMHSKCWPVNG